MDQSSSLTRRNTAGVRIFSDDNSKPLVNSIRPDSNAASSDASPLRQPPPRNTRWWRRTNRDNNDNVPFSFFGTNVTMAAWTGFCVKSILGMTVALYVLNQKHLLPKPLSAVVSKALFWPTLPITASRRIGTWTTVVDDTVVMGGAPFGFAGIPERLYEDYGVRGVINMCKEYAGPTKSYKKLGMKELWLPTVDHFEPSVQDLKSAVSFIESHKAKGDRVYVHCRAGHGRSAAAVFAYLLYQDPSADPKQLNEEFCQIRNVRKSLWRQPNIHKFHSWLKNGGKLEKANLPQQNAVLDITYHSDASDVD